MRSVLSVHWKDWCWSWNSNTLASWCEELTHWKRPWCWEGLGAGGEGDDRGWDGWMASPSLWTWLWVDSGSWWWTGRPSMLWFMGSQRVRHDWVTELNWTESFLCFAKAVKFNQVPLVYFCFYFHYSRRWVIENLALIYIIKYSALLSSKSFFFFLVFGLIFRSWIHFGFIFLYGD